MYYFFCHKNKYLDGNAFDLNLKKNIEPQVILCKKNYLAYRILYIEGYCIRLL